MKPIRGLIAVILMTAFGAQAQTANIPTVVVLSPAAAPNRVDDSFIQTLQRLGWTRNETVRLELRHFGGSGENLSRFVAEIVAMKPAVVAAWGPQSAQALKRATSQIPIVFLAAFADPVETGLVPNVARPGGNITGVSVFSTDMDAKRLQLLMAAVPSLRRIGLLGSHEQAVTKERRDKLADAAREFKVQLLHEEVESPAGLEAAVLRLKQQGAQALYVWPTGVTFSYSQQIAQFALAQRMPSVHGYSESALAGGLLSYAPPLSDVARRGAAYVDRILRGAKPGDMPIEQPSEIEFVVNLKTARALGFNIPQNLLLRADRVIE